MGQQELFDVIIVAARGAGPASATQLAHAVARRFGLAPGAVALGLDRGGIEIHRGLIKAEAIAAARALHDIGAVAEVRAARDASGVLTIEPDTDAIPTAVATAGSAEAAGLPPAPPFGVLETPPPRTSARPTPRPITGPQPATTRPMTGPQPSVERPTTRPPQSTPGPRPSPRAPVTSPPSDRSSARAAPADPRADPSSPTPRRDVTTAHRSDAPRTPAQRETPRPEPTRTASPELDTRAGSTRTRMAEPNETNTPLDPDAPAISRAALGDAPVAKRFAPPAAGERVELDLAAAGLSQSPVGTSALARSRSESSGVSRGPSSQEMPPAQSGTAARVPSESMQAAVSSIAPRPLPEIPRPGLLSPDLILSVLITATIGVTLGVIIAFGWVRGDAATACDKLEGELQASVADPIGVEEGRARAPDVITKELEQALEDLRSRFWFVWAVVALPIAAAGAIPRPGR